MATSDVYMQSFEAYKMIPKHLINDLGYIYYIQVFEGLEETEI